MQTRVLPKRVRQYTGMSDKGIDHIINFLTSDELGQWLNLIDGGHELYWKETMCPLCNQQDSTEHTLESCEKCEFPAALRLSLDFDTHVIKRA